MIIKGATIEVTDIWSASNEMKRFRTLKDACHYIASKLPIERADFLPSVGMWNLDTMWGYETEERYYQRMRKMVRGL